VKGGATWLHNNLKTKGLSIRHDIHKHTRHELQWDVTERAGNMNDRTQQARSPRAGGISSGSAQHSVRRASKIILGLARVYSLAKCSRLTTPPCHEAKRAKGAQSFLPCLLGPKPPTVTGFNIASYSCARWHTWSTQTWSHANRDAVKVWRR